MVYKDSFRKLLSWQLARELTLFVYTITRQFPPEERFVLMPQLRRSSYSVMANIAEGNARRSKKERLHFFTISQSSLTETDCGLELAHSLGYITSEQLEECSEFIKRTGYLLHRLILAQ